MNKAVLAESSWRADLGRVIEGQILPRLLLAHDARAACEDPAPREPAKNRDIAEFAQHLVSDDEFQARDHISRALGSGSTRDDVLLEILAPAARHLGKLWETDSCDFIDVTVGLRRLQDILRDLSARVDEDEAAHADAPRALLLPTPGESHVFGIHVVEAFFRSARWRVTRVDRDFLDLLRREWFDVVGFSLSGTRHVEALRAAVRAARAASLNRSVVILAGGPVLAEDPSLAAELGADATAIDAPSAVQIAGTLLRTRVRL